MYVTIGVFLATPFLTEAWGLILKLLMALLGAIIWHVAQRVLAKSRKTKLSRLAQGGLVKDGAAPAEYMKMLEREANRSVTSLLLTCFVAPFWFQQEGTREHILDIYQNAPMPRESKRRVVILSKKKIKKLKRQLDKYQEAKGTNKIDWFTKKNSFACFWACKEKLQMRYKPEDILLEDYALFDQAYIVRYTFAKRVLIVGGEENLVHRARRIFDDVGTLLKERIVFTAFDDLYASMDLNRIEHTLNRMRKWQRKGKKELKN